MKRTRAVLAVAVLMLSGSAFADTILYTVDDLGGGRWQYNYTVDNTGANALEEFEIFFDLDVYARLSLENTAAGWFSEVLQPDPSLPDDGFLLSYLDTALFPILPGGTLSGWSVSFDYLLAGTPGDQYFAFYRYDVDLDEFFVIGDGFTQRVAVPEPATLGLLSMGFILLVTMRRRQAAYSKRSK